MQTTMTRAQGLGRAARWLGAALAMAAMVWTALPAQAKDETGLWGQRMVHSEELPAEAVARFVRFHEKNVQTPAESARKVPPVLADTVAWTGKELDFTTKQSPYTLVIKVQGVALADGDVGARLVGGWVLDGATRTGLMPELAHSKARAGQVLELVGAALPVTLKEDRKIAPAVEFSGMRNLRMDSVRIEVWSGIRTSSPLELFMSWVPLVLGVVFLGFVWWARRQ